MNWLAALDRAAGGDVVLSPTDRSARPEQYLYLASVVGGVRQPTQLQLEAVVSYPKLTGGWAKPQQIRTQPGPGQAVYDRASDADRLLFPVSARRIDWDRYIGDVHIPGLLKFVVGDRSPTTSALAPKAGAPARRSA